MSQIRSLVSSDPQLHSHLASSQVEPDPETSAIFERIDNEWALSPTMAQFLVRVLRQEKRRSILEFGAGTSSLTLATALARSGGGRLTSIEHQPQYSQDAWRRVTALENVDASLIVAPLRLRWSRHGLLYHYDVLRASLLARAPFDLVLIDAPPGVYGRDAPLHQAYEHLAPGALIILDDSARAPEQTAVRRWLATYPGLKLVLYDDAARGIAVLRFEGHRGTRLHLRGALGSMQDRWIARRQTSS